MNGQNSGGTGYRTYYSNGRFTVTDQKTDASHVATDGKGGLKVVIATGDAAFVYSNPAILDFIKIHEGTHITEAYNSSNAIGNGLPAGLTVGAIGDTLTTTEFHAHDKQIEFLNKVLGNPSRYNLTQTQMEQVQWYRTFVQNDKIRYISPPRPPTIPQDPIPSSWKY